MKAYQSKFITLAIEQKIIQFGEFKLKSGRNSPYFFNLGKISTGQHLMEVAHCYAEAIVDAKVEFDVLFGPAYKGIPLAVAVSLIFARDYQRNVGFAYNRKEVKSHGEGGQLVGANVNHKRVLIIDDVMTAGTAIREACTLLTSANATISGIAIALDRQEIGPSDNQSAIQTFSHELQIPVFSIVNFSTLLNHVRNDSTYQQYIQALDDYRSQYGVKSD